MSRSMWASVCVDMEGIIESCDPQPFWCGDPNHRSILLLLHNSEVVTHGLRIDDKENGFKGWEFYKSSASLTDLKKNISWYVVTC